MRLIRTAGLVAVVAAVIVSAAAAFNIRQERLPVATVGTPYSYQVIVDGDPDTFIFSLLQCCLPPGLTLSESGRISGTPTAAGTYTFWPAVTSPSGGSSERPLTISVEEKLTVTTPSLPAATVAAAYPATQLTASGGGSQTWSVSAGSLPPGLVLSPTGVLSGTATTEGSYPFTVRVTDSVRSDTKNLAIDVVQPLVTTAATTLGGSGARPSEVGRPYGAKLEATGGRGPYTWIVSGGALPPGLAIDPVASTVSGIPTAAGSFPLTLQLTDSIGSSTTLSVTLVVAPKLAITTTRLRGTKAGRPYAATLQGRGGISPLTWRLLRGRLPRGVTFDPDTATFSGTPVRPGTFTTTVRVRDAIGAISTATFVLTVRP
jgi:hypothetical protein